MKAFENSDFKHKVTAFDEFKPSFSKKDILPEYIDKIKKKADEVAKTPVPMTPATLYRDFVRNGNRTRYQAPYFARRNALMKLTLGELTFDNGEYIDALIDYIWAICEETSWVLPAHNIHKEGVNVQYQLPSNYEDDVFFIDLFSAQTGAQLAIVWYLFRDKLEEACPDTIVRRMEYELNRRIIKPYEKNHKEFWWSGFGGRYVNNWNPWIISNILTVVAFFEQDSAKRESLTELCCQHIDNYIKIIPVDGSCDEGAGYWWLSCGAVFNFLEVLNDISAGKITVKENDILKNFCEYIVKMHITGKNEFVTFNDGARYREADFATLYRMGCLMNSDMLKSFAGHYFTKGRFFLETFPYAAMRYFSTVIPNSSFVHGKCYYLDNLQIMTARNTYNGKNVFVCAKAGANNEGHGHLDDGSFVLYIDEKPVFLDVGVQPYTKDTFNENRFKNWSLRSPYHNTASVDDIEQGGGGNFKTTNVVCDSGVISFELKDTFTDNTGIISIKRSINANTGFSVTDEYEFESEREYKFNLMSAAKPEVVGNTLTVKTPYGTVAEFEISDGYSVSYEEICEKSRVVELWDTECIYRTVLSNKSKKGVFCIKLK